jgi:hypothetical protein
MRAASAITAVGVLAALAGGADAADVTSSVTVAPSEVRLSESVRVTLAVEGDAPLRVELPAEVLDEQSSAVWRARPDGPAAVTDLPGGRQRWARTYRVDPYVPGKAVHLGFAPAKVSAGRDPQSKEVPFASKAVTVTTEVAGDAAAARPPTGIEEWPPAGGAAGLPGERAAILVAVGVAAAAAGAVLVRLLRRRPVSPPAPEAWAARELAALGQASDDPAFADRLSDTLRRFAEARTRAAATKLTTAELRAELERSGEWPPERAADLVAVLDRCDRVKFAADRPTADEAAGLLQLARRVVEPPAPPA